MKDAGMVQFLLEQLDDERVTARAMFGGHGIYRSGHMFALVYDDVVYMKVSDDEAKASERPPFRPRPNQTFRSFRAITADELENRAALTSLVENAHRAATTRSGTR